MKNIYICGFMGCGKSLVSKIIAKKLKVNCIDTDTKIKQSKNMQIHEIFEKYGESYFRQLESELLKSLQNTNNSIIATGGGTLISNRENAKIAKSNGIIIFLETPFELCWSRIKDSKRPLITNNSVNDVRHLYEKRQPQYKEISNIAVLNNKSSIYCANRIITIIKKRNNPNSNL